MKEIVRELRFDREYKITIFSYLLCHQMDSVRWLCLFGSEEEFAVAVVECQVH